MVSSSTSGLTPWPASDALEVRLLGLVDYDAALFLMERAANEISQRTDRYGALLLCEHPPLITVGREGSRADLAADPHELAAKRIGVRWISRGGGCVVHAPGQLAVYPIVPLDRLPFGLGEFRRKLEQAAIGVCEDLKLPAHRRDDLPGVWCRTGRVATVGVSVRSWVSRHGLFLDVSPEMRLARLASPSGERLTSLALERFSANLMHAARAGIIRHLASQLGYEQHHVYTGHPLLKRTRIPGHVHA